MKRIRRKSIVCFLMLVVLFWAAVRKQERPHSRLQHRRVRRGDSGSDSRRIDRRAPNHGGRAGKLGNAHYHAANHV